MQIWVVTLETSAAHLTESDPRTVVGVDICRNLENEARKLRFLWTYHALLRLCGTGRRGNLYDTVEKFLHTEIVEGRTKEHWCHLCLAVLLYVKLRIDAVYQLKVVTQLLGILVANLMLQLCAVDVYLHLFGHTLLVRLEQVEFVLINIIYSLELSANVYRPRQRTHTYL